MDDPALLADTDAMTSLSSAKPTLSTLPIEMLDRIFWLVDNSDLINLRLVCRLLCDVANRPFATRNFSYMAHVVTEESINILLAVSGHKVFGAYVKTIMISPARAIHAAPASLDDNEDDGLIVDNSFVESGNFSNLIQRVLSNLKRHSDLISIGVQEDSRLGHGLLDQDRVAWRPHLFHGEKAFCEAAKLGTVFQIFETFELLFTEMRAAAININGLSIEFAYHSCSDAKRRIHKAIQNLLKFPNPSIDLRFRWDSNGLLEYKHSQSCLRFSSSSLLFNRTYSCTNLLLLDDMVQQLTDTSLLELNLRDLDVGYLAHLDMYLAQSLRMVTLADIYLGSIFFAENLYSNMFERFSTMPNLRHCKLHRLHYVLQQDNDWSPHVMRTRSGTYDTRRESLLLILPDGKFDFDIQGADIFQQLKDLAAYTAAAERKKVQEVDTDREVIDHRVIGAGVPILKEEDLEYPSSAQIIH